MKRTSRLFIAAGAALSLSSLIACGSDALSGSGGNGGAGGDPAGVTSSASSSTASAQGGSGGTDGSGGFGGNALTLDVVLDALRQDLPGAMQAYSASLGWPLSLDGKYLFVSAKPNLFKLAGDHDQWAGTPMTLDSGFAWALISVPAEEHYKFTDGTTWEADPWSRSYTYDNFGEMSLARTKKAHLDRYFAVGDAVMVPRPVRVWVPEEPATHLIYVHDGQNLFDPDAIWGGWHLADNAPSGMMFVGIDNTPARIDEYTHVTDVISKGAMAIGGLGDAYADFLKNTVRPLIKARYGEPAKLGVMGSSLGGLISLHIADKHPGQYQFAASLSGTVGWGSIGDGVHNETIIERYAAHGHKGTVLYLDSSGYGSSCADADGDGIDDDDPNAADNYCENVQMRDALVSVGYTLNQDLHYWWEQDAQHNEAAWAARVFRPLQIFNAL